MDFTVGVVVFGAVIGVAYLIKVGKEAARAQEEARKTREQARKAYEQELINRHGPEIAALILAKKIRQGMTSEQVKLSWGQPLDVDQNVLKTKIKETWKYTAAGKNRFANRVFLENDMVVGWKDSY
jgi:hypothetical protein